MSTSQQIATGVYPGSQQGNAIRDLAANVAALEEVKVFIALLNQSGENAPTAKILKNTLGPATFEYVSSGTYSVTIAGAFPDADKVFAFGIVNDIENSARQVELARYDANTMYITSLGYTFSPADDLLINSPIEIRVYP